MSHCIQYNDPADCSKPTCEGCDMKNSNRVITNVATVYDGMSDEEIEAMESDPCFNCLGMGHMCIMDPNYEGEAGICLVGRC